MGYDVLFFARRPGHHLVDRRAARLRQNHLFCNKLRSHQGSCGYLRLEVPTQHGLEQGRDHCIDRAWLRDQIPKLHDLSDQTDKAAGAVSHALNLIEVQQFQAPAASNFESLWTYLG